MKTNNYCVFYAPDFEYDYDELYNHVRKRPQMYVGYTDFRGVRNTILSLVEYAINENKKEIIINIENNVITMTYEGSELPQNMDLDVIKALSESFSHLNNVLTYKLDTTVFNKLDINNDVIFDDLRTLAFLNKEVTITFNNHKFHYENGLLDLYDYFVGKSEYFYDEFEPFEISFHDENFEVDIVYSFTNSWSNLYRRILSYVNNKETEEHGSHVDGFLDGVKTALLEHRQGCCKEKESFRFLSVGFVIHVKKVDVHYYGATKRKVEDDEIYQVVKKLTVDKLKLFFEKNHQIAEDNLRCGHCRKRDNV